MELVMMYTKLLQKQKQHMIAYIPKTLSSAQIPNFMGPHEPCDQGVFMYSWMN